MALEKLRISKRIASGWVWNSHMAVVKCRAFHSVT